MRINLFKSINQWMIGLWPKKRVRRTIADYKQEALLNQGKEQFQALLKKGLSVPVVLL